MAHRTRRRERRDARRIVRLRQSALIGWTCAGLALLAAPLAWIAADKYRQLYDRRVARSVTRHPSNVRSPSRFFDPVRVHSSPLLEQWAREHPDELMDSATFARLTEQARDELNDSLTVDVGWTKPSVS